MQKVLKNCPQTAIVYFPHGIKPHHARAPGSQVVVGMSFGGAVAAATAAAHPVAGAVLLFPMVTNTSSSLQNDEFTNSSSLFDEILPKFFAWKFEKMSKISKN